MQHHIMQDLNSVHIEIELTHVCHLLLKGDDTCRALPVNARFMNMGRLCCHQYKSSVTYTICENKYSKEGISILNQPKMQLLFTSFTQEGQVKDGNKDDDLAVFQNISTHESSEYVAEPLTVQIILEACNWLCDEESNEGNEDTETPL